MNKRQKKKNKKKQEMFITSFVTSYRELKAFERSYRAWVNAAYKRDIRKYGILMSNYWEENEDDFM